MEDGAGEAWIERFVQGWQLQDRDEWFAHFEQLLADDVRLVQPVLPETRGREGLRQTFEPAFALLPDLRVVVTSSAVRDNELFIAFTMTGTPAGGQTVSWRAVDRIELNGEGLATVRESFFDPTTFLQAIQQASG